MISVATNTTIRFSRTAKLAHEYKYMRVKTILFLAFFSCLANLYLLGLNIGIDRGYEEFADIYKNCAEIGFYWPKNASNGEHFFQVLILTVVLLANVLLDGMRRALITFGSLLLSVLNYLWWTVGFSIGSRISELPFVENLKRSFHIFDAFSFLFVIVMVNLTVLDLRGIFRQKRLSELTGFDRTGR